jgi:hypothetical protein
MLGSLKQLGSDGAPLDKRINGEQTERGCSVTLSDRESTASDDAPIGFGDEQGRVARGHQFAEHGCVDALSTEQVSLCGPSAPLTGPVGGIDHGDNLIDLTRGRGSDAQRSG